MSATLEELQAQLEAFNVRLNEIEDARNRDMHALEHRLSGLEKMAVDAIGSARKCIVDALQRHEERIDNTQRFVDAHTGKILALESQKERIEALEVKSKDEGKVAGGVSKNERRRLRG